MIETPSSPPGPDAEPFFTVPDQVPGPFSATTELVPGAQEEIDGHSALIASHFALAETACHLIDLAVIAGTLGTSRVISDPLTRVPTPLSMRVMILSAPGSMADAAILHTTAALRDLVDAARQTRSRMKISGVRARRIELEQISAALIEQIRNPRIPPHEPFSMPVPREIAIKDRQIAMLPNAERVAGMLLEHALIENPDIITDVITTKEIDDRMSLDRGLMSISPGGDALGALMSASPAERRRIAMMSGWSGGDISISALWGASEAEARRAMTICEPLLRDFLIVESGATDADVTTPACGAWDDFVLRLLRVRLQQEVIAYELDRNGKSEFLSYVNRTRRMLREIPEVAVAALWPQQVLKVTALLHILAGGLTTPLIDAKHLLAAVSILDEVGGTQLRLRSRCAADSLEHQVSVMIAKVRRHGPLTRRQLFRRYDRQDYPRLLAILRAGVDRGAIQESGQLLSAINEVSVSVASEPELPIS